MHSTCYAVPLWPPPPRGLHPHTPAYFVNQILRRAIEHVSACESDRCQQASRISPTGEMPAGDRWLCRRAIVQQHDSIGDNNRRDFHPQVIDDRSCRDMLQQEHLKSQQAIDGNSRRAIVQQHDSIGDNSRRAMLQQQHSIDPQVDSTACEAGGIAHSKISFRLIAIESCQLEDSS